MQGPANSAAEPKQDSRQGSTRKTSRINRFMVSPSVLVLALWMVIPLSMTIYFSVIRYNLLYPGDNEFVGLENFQFFVTDFGFMAGMSNTLLLVGSVLLITVVLGVLISLLVNQAFWGRGIVRILLISPFFIMPTRERADLEEPAAASGIRCLCSHLEVFRCHADRLVFRVSVVLDHHDRVMAVAAVRHPAADDRIAVAGSGTAGSGTP